MMGISFTTLFIGNNIIGTLGAQYETWGALTFWLVHAGIGAAGALLVLIFGPALSRALHPRDESLRPAAMTHEVER